MANLTNAFGVAGAVITSVGGAGLIFAGLSSWLGKVWANRLMANAHARHEEDLAKLTNRLIAEKDAALKHLENELEIFKAKDLGLHADKVGAYRLGVDLVASILSDLDRHRAGRLTSEEASAVHDSFNKNRMRLYGYLAMLSPQSLMDAVDNYLDHLLAILNGEIPYDWQAVREKGLILLREIRSDLGVPDPHLEYRGER